MSNTGMRMPELLPADDDDPVAKRETALLICGRARDADDARLLLDACGLL